MGDIRGGMHMSDNNPTGTTPSKKTSKIEALTNTFETICSNKDIKTQEKLFRLRKLQTQISLEQDTSGVAKELLSRINAEIFPLLPPLERIKIFQNEFKTLDDNRKMPTETKLSLFDELKTKIKAEKDAIDSAQLSAQRGSTLEKASGIAKGLSLYIDTAIKEAQEIQAYKDKQAQPGILRAFKMINPAKLFQRVTSNTSSPENKNKEPPRPH